MQTYSQHYINGRWVDSINAETIDLINPATEQAFARVTLGGQADVDAAARAAKQAFAGYALTSKAQRIAIFESIIEIYRRREEELAQTICQEMGAPIKLSRRAQVPSGRSHLETALDILRDFSFEHRQGNDLIVSEPIGVCGLITPWNWPLNQITCKVAPALAAGCTMVLKPSEQTPLSGLLFAEIMDEAGVPPGVFNLVSGNGLGVGVPLSQHPLVDMVSFTGSTRAGIEVARNAAPTIKRVAQELGGKSANIILDSANLEEAAFVGALRCFGNSGQTCTAPTRMLVPENQLEAAAQSARRAAQKMCCGDPADDATRLGPVASKTQYEKIQQLIGKGIEEGAQLVAGGTGRSSKFAKGYYVEATVLSAVSNDMSIAREEIFGPVLSIIPYRNEEEAIAIANDSNYGLAAYVQGEAAAATKVARRLRAGMVGINDVSPGPLSPFGGYKQSGNGRECGEYGLNEYLEVKALPDIQ